MNLVVVALFALALALAWAISSIATDVRKIRTHFDRIDKANAGWIGGTGEVSQAELNKAKDAIRSVESIPLTSKAEISFSIDEVLDAIAPEGRAVRIDVTTTNGDGPKKMSVVTPKPPK